MANDVDAPRGEDFSIRIDDLVASALEDQAREKQLITETVTAATTALSSARSELASIRELIDQRDRAVVDAIETRLSGVGTELTLSTLVEGLDELSRRKPAEETVGALLPKLESLEQHVKDLETAFATADPWKPAAEVKTALQEGLGELSANFNQRLSTLSEAVSRSDGALEKEIKSELVQRLDALSEASSARLETTRDEVVERIAMATTSQLETTRDEVVERIAMATTSQLETTRDDVIKRIVAASTAQLGSINDELTQALAASTSEQSSSLTGWRTDVKEVLQRTTSRLSDKLVSHQVEMTAVLAGLLEPYEHELQEFVEGIRRTNLRIRKTNDHLDELRQALVAHVAYREQSLKQFREEVVGDIVAQISDGLEKPDRKRMVDAMRESKERKKDKRDAERYRKLAKGGKITSEPEPPPAAEPPLLLADTESPVDSLVGPLEPVVSPAPVLPKPRTAAPKTASKRQAKPASASTTKTKPTRR